MWEGRGAQTDGRTERFAGQGGEGDSKTSNPGRNRNLLQNCQKEGAEHAFTEHLQVFKIESRRCLIVLCEIRRACRERDAGS